jgi:hypothetical protein
MTIDWTKPIESVGGKPARVLSEDCRTFGGANLRVVQVEYQEMSGLHRVYDNGCNTIGEKIIRNRKVKKEAWMNLHQDCDGVYEGGSVYKSEESARKAGRDLLSYVATVKIEWEE